MTFLDPLTLHTDALTSLIRSRVFPRPSERPLEDWRFGALSSERRRSLQAFFPEKPVPAAVLVPLVRRAEGLQVLLTERAKHLQHHAGQVSFPGGRIEPDDADAQSAALREAEEEIGLPRQCVEVIGYLPDHLIISGYQVTPVVAWVRPPFELTIDTREVTAAFEVPLEFILDSRNHVPRSREFQGETLELIDLPYGAHNIWGATAGMLLTLQRLLRGEAVGGVEALRGDADGP